MVLETKNENTKPIDTIGLVLLVVGVGTLPIRLDRRWGKNPIGLIQLKWVYLRYCTVVALSFLIVWG